MAASKSWHFLPHFHSENGNNGYRRSETEVFPIFPLLRNGREANLQFTITITFNIYIYYSAETAWLAKIL